MKLLANINLNINQAVFYFELIKFNGEIRGPGPDNKKIKCMCNEVPIIVFLVGFYSVVILLDKHPKYKKPNGKS